VCTSLPELPFEFKEILTLSCLTRTKDPFGESAVAPKIHHQLEKVITP
jgi:hypothetical protein